MHQQPDLILERQPGGTFLPRNLAAPRSEAKFPANRPLELLALEDRVLYSAVPLDPQLDPPEPEPTTEPLNLDSQLANLEHWAALLDVSDEGSLPSPTPPEAAVANPNEQGNILVVIDRGVENYELLLDDIQSRLPPDHTLLLIDSTTDGWLQLTQYLQGQSGIQEIHLFSHAASGELQLGTARVDLDDLLNDESSAIWQRALNPNADILLYGCELAADSSGQSFISQFALFSGADIAASVDQSGTTSNADWDLEYTVGELSGHSLFSSVDTLLWEGELAAQALSLSGEQNLGVLDRGSADAVAMHSDGSFVIVWSHDFSGNWGIRAARFFADGTQNGGLISVNETTVNDQRYATIDMDDAGNFVISWTSPSDSPGTADIYARWFGASSGSSSEFRVNSHTSGGQLNSSVSMAGDGRFAVAWEGNGAEDSQGIYVRLYNASRTPLGSQIFVNPSATGSQENPVVSMNDSGDFVVSWNDETSFQYQRFDASGTKVGGACTVSSTGTAKRGDVLLNDDGTVVVTWQENNGSMWDVYWQRNAANDSILTSKTLIRVNNATDQLAPSVDGNGDGNFVITWEAGEYTDSWGVFYQLYKPTGLATPTTFWANSSYSTGYQGNASVALNSLEQLVVVWSGQSSFDSNDIGYNNVLNRFPTPSNDAGSAIESSGYNNSTPGLGAFGNVLGNDTDPDAGDTLSVQGVISGIGGFSSSNLGTSLAGLYGSLTLNSDGEYTYALNNSHAMVQALRTNADTLTDTFTYTVQDQRGMAATATITVTIRGRNDAPTANADTAIAVEAGGLANGSAGTNPTGNALANDTDPDTGDTKTVTGVAAGVQAFASGNVGNSILGAYGNLTMAADGSFSYVVDNLNANVQALRTSSQTLIDVFTYTFSDAGGLGSTSQLTVTIQGANDTPQLTNLAPVSVNENAPNGTLLTSAVGNDPDAGETLSFSLSDNAGGRFTVNSSTGAITVANSALLNYEAATSHNITIRITDLAGSFSEQTLAINLLDVDEFDVGPVSDANAAANSIAENSANGSTVGITAAASDADGSNNTITYSLTNTAGGRFTINSSTGVVTVADGSLLNFESATSYTITVRATSTDGSFTDQAFTITVTDVDEFNVGPVNDANAATNSIAENSANGSTVGVTASASDADGSNNTITYSLTNTAGGRFAINSSTGVVTVADGSLLNFESATSHTITVRATSADGSFTDQNFTIAVTDVDEFDAGPVSDANAAANSSAENAANGSTVGITASASDADGSNNTITYSLTNTAGGRFAINSSTGVVTVANGSLLSFESATSHTLTVRATSTDGSFTDQNFTIAVTDVDEFDIGPVLDSNSVSNLVRENAATGETVGITGFASDLDGTANAITYSLEDDAGGRFAIDSSTGVVTVANGSLINYEEATSQTITIRASSADGSFSTGTFTFLVENINEAPTAISDHGLASEAGGLSNSTGGNNASGNVLTNDLDPDQNESLTVIGVQAGTIPPSAGPVGLPIAGSYGTLLLNTDGSYTYTVNNAHPAVESLRHAGETLQDTFSYRMRDANGLESTSQLAVTISGANDTPDSIWSESGIEINQGSSNNQYIHVSNFGNLLAGTEFTLRLSLSTTEPTGTFFSYATHSDHNEFRLHLAGGRLKVFLDGQAWNTNVAASLLSDGERHELSIVRTSADGGVAVYLDGVLRDARAGWKTGLQLEANGSMVLGHDQDTFGGGFQAADAFHGSYWDLAVHSTAWDGARLNLAGGQTSHTSPDLLGHWDFEIFGGNSFLDLIGGRHGSLLSLPAGGDWIAGDARSVASDWTPKLAENATAGTVISQLNSHDVDAGETLTWSLLDNAGGRFTIDSSTGVLKVASSELLNFEQSQSHSVVVLVADSAGLTRQETYTIQLTDIQESGVSLPADLNVAEDRVDENSPAGASTGIQVWAIDEDGTDNLVTYSLLDDAGGRFTIDTETGIVTVLDGSLLDREQADSHRITVRATSADGTFADKILTIQVTDLDEFDIGPINNLDPQLGRISENATAGTSVGILAFALDQDATRSSVQYSLDDDAHGRFAIDASSGLVTVAGTGLLDYETAMSHTITIRATSEDGSFSQRSFTIGLSDANEFNLAPVFDADSLTNLIFENSVAGTFTGVRASAVDQDGTQNVVSWRLLNDDNGRFTIDPFTGMITTSASLDFESLGAARFVEVEGTSADGSRSTGVFQIEIGDVLTESYTVFSGLNLSMKPSDLLLSTSRNQDQFQTLTFTDIPVLGQLYVVSDRGRQLITTESSASVAIPVGQQVIYVSPTTSSGSVVLAYSAATSSGQTRTGTVTIQVEPAVIVVPPAPPSELFRGSSGSTASNNSGNSTVSESRSSSSSGDNNQPRPSSGETSPSGDSPVTGGGALSAVGPLPTSGGIRFSEESADVLPAMASESKEWQSVAGDKSRSASGNPNQASDDSAFGQQFGLATSYSTGVKDLQTQAESSILTRVTASAESIQQEFLATAQFGEYLSKLDSALKETPLIVGFEMPAYATAGASLFTVGYVAWLIRGGVLLTSFMSSIPSWQSFDPLPILENAGSDSEELAAEGSDTSIAELVDSEQPAPSMAVSLG
ncbi:MAG: cadherin domain-containing protein [Planctomycetota bacterium]